MSRIAIPTPTWKGLPDKPFIDASDPKYGWPANSFANQLDVGAAFNAAALDALAQGKSLYVPPGNYWLTTPMVALGSSTAYGPDLYMWGAVFNWRGSNGLIALTWGEISGYVRKYGRIFGGRFYGTAGQANTTGVRIQNAASCLFEFQVIGSFSNPLNIHTINSYCQTNMFVGGVIQGYVTILKVDRVTSPSDYCNVLDFFGTNFQLTNANDFPGWGTLIDVGDLGVAARSFHFAGCTFQGPVTGANLDSNLLINSTAEINGWKFDNCYYECYTDGTHRYTSNLVSTSTVIIADGYEPDSVGPLIVPGMYRDSYKTRQDPLYMGWR